MQEQLSRDTRNPSAVAYEAESSGSPAVSRPPSPPQLERFPSRTSTGPGDDPAAWVPEEVLSRCRQHGSTYFLIRWRNYAEPTWEIEEALDDWGCLPLIHRFLEQRDRAAKKKPPPKFGLKVFDPTTYWPDFLERICGLWNQSAHYNCKLVRVESVCTMQQAEAFTRLLEETYANAEVNPETGKRFAFPAMLFHGTAVHNLQSIITNGLHIPGQGGVRVINGSAYGVGIYTARDAATSTGYVRDCSMMLCCAGLIINDKNTVIQATNNFVVFFKRDYVVPCFLLTYERTMGPVQARPENVQYHDRLVTDLPALVKVAAAAAQQGRNPPPPPMLAVKLGRGAEAAEAPDGAAPRWFKYQSATKRQLKSMPRSAKQAFREGELPGPPKADRSRARPQPPKEKD